LRAYADSQILNIEMMGFDGSFYELRITFRKAECFDFLRDGMAWRFHTSGDLCPRCFCIQSQV